jgi:hypothetical protein
MEKFRIRPEYGGTNLLIEFSGDHRAADYPNVPMLLAAALGATQQKHPVFSAETMIANDRYFSYWSYKNGIYEIDNDIWACFINVPDGSSRVIADVEHALTNSGQFVKEDVAV